jgi:2,4-dienoyl-CoA reductase (NADPH2)
VNPRIGHEVEPEYKITPAVLKKKVIVIGGGAAGLECAFRAALRGHEVCLYEREGTLGGQLRAASKEVGGGKVFTDLVRYYEHELKNLNVEVKLRIPATSELIADASPDVCVIATGSVIDAHAMLPEGTSESSLPIAVAHEVLLDKITPGTQVAVIGGTRIGLVTAEHLASQGKNVCVIERGRKIAEDVIPTFKWRHYAWLKEFGIKTYTNAKPLELTDECIIIKCEDGKTHEINADTIVVAAPRVPVQELLTPLEFICDELYIIGDAVRPRGLHNAIHEGFRVGVRI